MQPEPEPDNVLPEEEVKYAAPDSLLGQLQRGRGAGFISALASDYPSLHDYLISCITIDPRFDGQVEERADYYARLALISGLNLDGLRSYLQTVTSDRLDWSVALTLETLARLSQLDNPDALPLLRDYVAFGTQWHVSLEKIADHCGPHALVGLDNVICGRFATGEELDAASTYVISSDSIAGTYWERWAATNPCIARLLREISEADEAYSQAHTSKEPLRLEELEMKQLLNASGPHTFFRIGKAIGTRVKKEDEALLVMALHGSNPFAWYPALTALQKIGEADPLYQQLLKQATTQLYRLPQHSGPHVRTREAITRTLMLMPPEITLPLARAWFASPNWHLDMVSRRVLEAHATMEDAPLIIGALSDHLSADPENLDDYLTCSLLTIASRFPNIGVVEDTVRVYTDTRYSPARRRAAAAMRANAPDWFAETYAYESMWDCDPDCRRIGCEAVSLAVLGARDRLAEIAADNFEDTPIGKAAQERLSPA